MIKTDLFDEIISSVAVFKVKSEQRDTGVVCPLPSPFMIVQLLLR